MLRALIAMLGILSAAACGDSERAPRPPMGSERNVDAGFDPDIVRPGEQDAGLQGPPAELEDWALADAPAALCFGLEHACGLDRDGRARCWGDDAFGRATPPPDTNFTQLACGEGFTCGLTTEASIECWGAGTSADEYSGAHYGQSRPPQGEFKEVAAGGAHACAITADDDVVCWGAGRADAPVLVPPHFGQATPPDGKWRSITAHQAHTCALDRDSGEPTCWGAGGTDADCFPPRSWECGQGAPVVDEYERVVAGFAHSCGLHPSGRISCWGRGVTNDNCDPDDFSGAFYDCGQSSPPDGSFKWLAAGFFHTCAIDLDDALICWGENGVGQADPPDGRYTQVAAGDHNSCAVTQERSVVCFGRAATGLNRPPAELP